MTNQKEAEWWLHSRVSITWKSPYLLLSGLSPNDITIKSSCDSLVIVICRFHCKVIMITVSWWVPKWSRKWNNLVIYQKREQWWLHNRVSITWKSPFDFIVTSFGDSSQWFQNWIFKRMSCADHEMTSPHNDFLTVIMRRVKATTFRFTATLTITCDMKAM